LKISKIPIVKKIARAYLYKTLPKKTKALGYEFYLQKNGAVSLDLTRRGIFEVPITNYVKNNLKDGQWAIDVGANIGYYSLLFSGLVGKNGKVFSFEPEKSNFEILKKNLAVNSINNVQIENVAISNTDSEGKLYLSKIAGQHKIYSSFSDTGKTADIKILTLDSWFKKNQIDYRKISFIKIDVEGAELAVVEGMTSLLTNKNLTVILEFSPKMINDFGKKSERLPKLFTENGFEIYAVNTRTNEMSKTDNLTSKIDEIGKITTPYLICVTRSLFRIMVLTSPTNQPSS